MPFEPHCFCGVLGQSARAQDSVHGTCFPLVDPGQHREGKLSLEPQRGLCPSTDCPRLTNMRWAEMHEGCVGVPQNGEVCSVHSGIVLVRDR